MMIRAVVRNGLLEPLDPLPEEWTEGNEVELSALPLSDEDLESLDKWYRDMEELAAEVEPEDIKRIDAALAEADRLAKEQVRRDMGLS